MHITGSAPWLQAYDQDQAISDPYAGTSQAEVTSSQTSSCSCVAPLLTTVQNVAQETVISIFDKVVPGGIGTIEPNWNAIFHQYATLQYYAGQTIIPGGTCIYRLANR